MHEARAVADVVSAAETVAAGRRLTRMGIRVEGDGHVTADMIRMHKMMKMKGEIDLLRERMKQTVDVDVEHLAERLNLQRHRV